MCFPVILLTEPFPSVNTQRHIAGLQCPPIASSELGVLRARTSTAQTHWLKGAPWCMDSGKLAEPWGQRTRQLEQKHR